MLFSKTETKGRNHGDGDKVACCCGVEQQKKEELVVPASRCQAANKWIAEKSAEIRYQKKSKVNTKVIFHQNPDKRKTSPKTTLHRTFQLSQITPSPKKIPRPYYPSDRASDLLLPFRWCFTSAQKLRKNKNTSNRQKNRTRKSEAFQCPESNTIIDPGTMVIHLQNTGLTWARGMELATWN